LSSSLLRLPRLGVAAFFMCVIGVAPAHAARVLLLADDTTAGTTALTDALTAAGHQVTTVAPEHTWDAANPSLAEIDVVVHLNGATHGDALSVTAQEALQAYVAHGGGYIGGQWNGYEQVTGAQVNMNDLVLQSFSGGACAYCSITYVAVPGRELHPILDGMPQSFTFRADAHNAGDLNEFALQRPTELMRTTTTDGRPGVIVREFGDGRVVNFSFAPNDVSSETLQDANILTLYLNAVKWASDRTRPENQPPTAAVSVDHETAEATSEAGASFALDATESSDPDGDPLTFEWTGVMGAVSGERVSVTLPPSAAGTKDVAHTITLTVHDGRGGSATKTVVLTVTDNIGPVISGVPAYIKAEATSPEGAVVDFGSITAVDAVDGERPVTCTASAGATFPIGTTAVTCSSVDLRGNSLEVSFDITVADTIAPSLMLPANQTLEAASAEGAAATFEATAKDIVDGEVAVTCTPTSGITFPLGASTVTCTATDAAGNKSDASFTVTVRDTTAPTLSMPANVTLEATGVAGAVATFALPTATDLVDASVSITCSASSGNMFPLGVTDVKCSAIDDSGNVATGVMSVTVRDTTAPTLSLPTNLILEATTAAGAPAIFAATATDLVDASVAVVCSMPSGSFFPLGMTSVNCSATDDSGNATTGVFSVTVRDTTPPALGPITPSQTYMWAPNHVLADVMLAYNVSDLASSPVCSITVASDEAVDGSDSDWVVIDATHVQLRSEREGTGDGRIYTITVTCADAAGNSSSQGTSVYVPKSQSSK
jgi:hypothetical protein